MDDLDVAETDEAEGSEEPSADDPSKILGYFAPFDVSDQKEWTEEALLAVEGDKLTLVANIRNLVVAAAQRESMGHRLSVVRAWSLELADRGFLRQIPAKGGGWNLPYQGTQGGYDIFGGAALQQYHDLNVLGVHNDIIVNALKREPVKTEFDPKTDDDKAVTAASKANKLKVIIGQDSCYKVRQAEASRLFCTDAMAVLLTVPTADALNYGFEDDSPDVTPETESDVSEATPGKRPRIQTRTRVFGKLEHKGPIALDNAAESPYQILSWEEDVASERGCFPWVADKITGGSCGIAELELDRTARQSVKLAMAGRLTGQAAQNDSTRLQGWISPKFYQDDSCTEEARKWLLKTYPKGFLAVYSGAQLCFVRNESWQEVLTVLHARSGKGQNRRALTEAYFGAQMILNNLIDLLVKFFTSTVPRNYYDEAVFNVAQLRNSGNEPGRKEPFLAVKVTPNVQPILTDPLPTHQPALPDFISRLTGDLAELLTGAQLTLQGAQSVEGEPGTLGEAQMDNESAMLRLSEPWVALCDGFSRATLQAIQWNARVQPKGKVFDRVTKDMGRIRIEMADLDANLLVVADNDSNIPESFTEREERVWQLINNSTSNPFLAATIANPANARIIKDAARMGITITGADSWEKQEGEFALLLEQKPQPNPALKPLQIQMLQMKQHMEEGAADLKQRKETGQPIDPQEISTLEQGMQAMQQLQQQMQALPQVSSVPVRQDSSEEHAIEAACCLLKMIQPEGRRLAHSTNKNEVLAFQNLHLHWAEHDKMAKQIAKQNQQPVEPKVSITADISKMPPQWQATMLGKMDVAVDPQQANEMGPHEIEHTIEGQNASGATEKITTKLAGKSLD